MSRIILLISIAFVFNLKWSYTQEKIHLMDIVVDNPMKGFDFACLEVIDKRPNKEYLGVVHKGRNNKPAQAKLEKGFPLTMTFLMANLLPRTKNTESLVFIFHEFSVKEIIKSSNDIGIATVKIEVARKIESDMLSLGLFESSFETVGFDVTNMHSFGLYMALKDCIHDLNYSDWENNKGVPLQSNLNNLTSLNHPNFNPPNGLYYSFVEVLKHEPSKNNFDIEMDSQGKRVCHYYLSENDKPIKTKVRYVVENGYIYISAKLYPFASHRGNNSFIKAKNRGRFIYFEDKNSNGRPMANVVGGLVGAALTSSAFGFILDTKNGGIYKLSHSNVLELIKGYSGITMKYKNSDRLLEDRKHAIIALNKFL